MLHCVHLNERLEFGLELITIISHAFINNNGSIIPCRTAILDFGLDMNDPGMTPDGVPCGDDKVRVFRMVLVTDSNSHYNFPDVCQSEMRVHFDFEDRTADMSSGLQR